MVTETSCSQLTRVSQGASSARPRFIRDISQVHHSVTPSEPVLSRLPIPSLCRLRTPTPGLCHAWVQLSCHTMDNVLSDHGNLHEAVSRTSHRKRQTWVLGMLRYQKVSVRSICAPTYPSERKWSLREVRHCLLQESPNALFRAQRNLVSSKGLRDLRGRVFDPVAVTWMLVADLQLGAVGFMKKPRSILNNTGRFLYSLDSSALSGICARVQAVGRS